MTAQNWTDIAVIAAGRVTGATGATIGASGATIARTGVGVYTLTLPDGGVDGTQCMVLAMPCAATAVPLGFEVVHTSDTVKTITVRTSAAGNAATDSDFNFILARLGPL